LILKEFLPEEESNIKMKIGVPFYKNDGDGNQCMQVAMKCVLDHFLGKNLSLKHLDELTGRKEGYWTYTSQIVSVLDDLDLDVKFYSREPLGGILGGEDFIRKTYGVDADKILKFTDLPVVIESVKKLMKFNIFEKKLLDFKEIEEHIIKGNVPLILIDHYIIEEKEGKYNGHFVVLTGFDEENVCYHESGPRNPEPHKKVTKEKFIRAWNAKPTDNDVVIVMGPKM